MLRTKEFQTEPYENKNKSGFLIAGTMNVGKSVLFSRLCGTRDKYLHFSGIPASVTAGHVSGMDRIAFDTPGIYSIFSTNEDSKASRKLLFLNKGEYDIGGIVLVADAKNLKRSIAIALQYSEFGLPMMLNMNMVDEAASRGIEIDLQRLSEILGIDVCPTIAREGIGIQKLMSKLPSMRTPDKVVEYPSWVRDYLKSVARLLGPNPISPRVK